MKIVAFLILCIIVFVIGTLTSPYFWKLIKKRKALKARKNYNEKFPRWIKLNSKNIDDKYYPI